MNRRELLAALPALAVIPFGVKAVPGASSTEIVGAAHELQSGKKYLFVLNAQHLIDSGLWPSNPSPMEFEPLQKALTHTAKIISEKFGIDAQFFIAPSELKIYEMS